MSALTKELPNGALFLPAKNRGSDSLLIALHGSGGSFRDFEGLEKYIGIADLNYLYLNGPIASYSNFSWYDSSRSRYAAYDFLEKAFASAEREGYPPEKTLLLGFSQGAALTVEFGVRYRKLLAGYIAISGRVEEVISIRNEGNREVIERGRWLITHGSRDYNLSLGVIKEQVALLQEMGMQIDFREYDKIHEIDPDRELVEIREWIMGRLMNE